MLSYLKMDLSANQNHNYQLHYTTLNLKLNLKAKQVTVLSSHLFSSKIIFNDSCYHIEQNFAPTLETTIFRHAHFKFDMQENIKLKTTCKS